MLPLYFALVVVLYSFYLGIFHLMGRRVLISTRLYWISYWIVITGITGILTIDSSGLGYSEKGEILIVMYKLLVLILPISLALVFGRDKYHLYNSNKEEIRKNLEDYLNANGVVFKNEDDVLLLGEDYDEKIKYTASGIDLSECRDVELKKSLIKHIKTKGKYGSKNIKVGVFIIMAGICFLLFIYYIAFIVPR